MTTPDPAAAREQAEEALRQWDKARIGDEVERGCEMAAALRALLAATDGAGEKDCPDCGVTETATGWTLRRCDRHRIEMQFPAPSPASDEMREAERDDPNSMDAPYPIGPRAVHNYGCPATKMGKKSGPCNCGGDAMQARIDASRGRLRRRRKGGEGRRMMKNAGRETFACHPGPA